MLRVSPLFLVCALLNAQEIKYIDLTVIEQRTDLRHPPAPPANCEEGKPCRGGGYGSLGIADGSGDPRDPHALGVYLQAVTPTDIDPAEPFDAEFRVLNTGLVPIDIPVSPHLSDLQPADESAQFSYFSLALVVEARMLKTPSLISSGFVELYGSPDHAGTILALRPGEWICVKAKLKVQNWPMDPVPVLLRGEFWPRRNTFYPHPGGASYGIENLYPNHTPTPSLAVHLVRSVRKRDPKQ